MFLSNLTRRTDFIERQLIGLPDGESVVDYRDRAILKTFLLSGIRLRIACRLRGFVPWPEVENVGFAIFGFAIFVLALFHANEWRKSFQA